MDKSLDWLQIVQARGGKYKAKVRCEVKKEKRYKRGKGEGKGSALRAEEAAIGTKEGKGDS